MWGATKREFIKAKTWKLQRLPRKINRKEDMKINIVIHSHNNIIQQQNKRANAQTKGYLY